MKLLNWRFLLSCSFAVSTLLLVTFAQAGNFTIVSGQTVTTTQVLSAPFDIGIVEPGGTISGPIGIQAVGGNNTVKNDGTVKGVVDGIAASNDNIITNSGTVTGGVDGIRAVGGNTITNSGTVTGNLYGIVAKTNNTITNSGTLTGNFYGILAYTNNTITNNGTVTGGSEGILAVTNNTITNSGTLTGNVVGILAIDGNTITNSGTVTGNLHGIVAKTNNTITNSGTLTGGHEGILAYTNNTITNSGTVMGGFEGILATDNNTISNSGTIKGGVLAVKFAGSSNTLNLQSGSNIQGGLFLGNVLNKLIIGPGLNTALAFTGGTIDTGGLPFIINAGKLYAVDVTGFSVQGEMVNDLTRIVAGTVDSRLASVRAAGEGLSAMADGNVIHATADLPAEDEGGVWLSALGAARSQGGSDKTIDYSSLLGGFMIGADGMVSQDIRVGAFGGLSTARLNTRGDAQDLSSQSVFAGLYAGHDMGQSFLDTSLSFGWTGFKSDRHIANNQVPGGIETATANYNGLLVSPSVTLGTNMQLEGGILTPSLRARYTGLFLESYTETGSSANLSVNDRSLNMFDARAQLAYGITPQESESGVFAPIIRIGVDGTLSGKRTVDATLLGQALNFDPANNTTLRGFVGFDASYTMANNMKFVLTSEAGYDTAKAFTSQATASFVWAF